MSEQINEANVTKATDVANEGGNTGQVKQEQEKPNGLSIDEHMMPLDAVCSRLDVAVDTKDPLQSKGLNSALVQQRLETYGPNMMTPPKEVPLILRYFICLANLFNILLIVAGILCFILAGISGDNVNSIVGAVLVGVALINALIEFVQEIKSHSILKSFMDMVPRNCMVVRESKLVSIPAADLVPGDVVFCRMGDKMPADIRVFWSSEFKVDNSSLTGESDPQERGPANEHKNPLEATNLAFNGSLIVNGEAYGIVIKTGDKTVLGQIANMASSEEKRVSPLTVEIEHFVKVISGVAMVFAFTFFGVGWSRISSSLGTNDVTLILSRDFQFAIGMFVSFVPEGLPATVTTLLSIAAKRMASRNVLVKDLKGVETLGAITCLATDKTGTLTRNQMTVTYVWSGNNLYDAYDQKAQKDGSKGKDLDGAIEMENVAQEEEKYPPFDMKIPELETIANIAYLCSKAKFDRTDVPIKQRGIIADATETGLFSFAANNITDSDGIREKYPKVFEIPFNSSNKWALSIHEKKHATGVYTLYIKGAPERVWKLCTSIMKAGGDVEPVSDSHREAFTKAYELMASKGHRVIGCAKLELSAEQFPEGYVFKKDEKEAKKIIGNGGVYPKTDYVFCGLVSLEDPPKHGVREAIGKCRQAGVKVMMVTGDHPLTAEAIGRKINLVLQETKEMIAKRTKRPLNSIQEHEYNAVVIHGEQIDGLSEEDWERILSKEEIIFARTSPKHKLQIVKRCQARGHIVGVTGDGVNDSPALKKADLGIAMNISGSDVSKEAAEMILLDDNFASTVAGISEGRLIFQNLKKSIRYTICHTVPQVMANLLYIVVPMPLPLNALQIIVVDLGFEMFMALAYAFEGPEVPGALMTKLPRKPVTQGSIDLLMRERALEEKRVTEIKNSMGLNDDTENVGEQNNGQVLPKDAPLSLRIRYHLASIAYWFKSWGDSEAWAVARAPRQEEILVDNDVLSYAYLEIGVLEAVGCFLAYFHVWSVNGYTPAQVVQSASDSTLQATGSYQQIVSQAQSAYYFGLMIQQLFNHFVCKGSGRLPFGMFVLKNKYTWAGLVCAVLLASFIVYVPGVQFAFGTAALNPMFWSFPLLMGVFILFYGSMRVLIMNRFKPSNPNMALPLDLHPTRFSTRSK
ncbi:hypothetical protein MP638_006256 [Amoeboaphelidium occidentale]|nr:hypothetical protein MP638_006256 [Amoeboaphelidium occidentale]